MKKNIRLLFGTLLALSVTFVSCKKIDKATDSNTELAVHSEDQARVAAETDAIANDANDIIDNNPSFNGRPGSSTSLFPLPCNVSLQLDTVAGIKRLTATYSGNNCLNNRSRTGVIVLSMPVNAHWGDVGAVLSVEAQNLKITRLADGKSITINGTSTITNVSGGRLYELATLGNDIRHDISSTGLTVTFDDGTQRVWQVAKKRVFSYNNGIVITVTGTHTDGNITGISEWGTNRFGNPFVTSISSPLVVRQDCAFRLVSGQVTHQRLIATVVTTFGLDASGNPVTTCPGGVYYFKTVWTGVNGVVRTIIYPY